MMKSVRMRWAGNVEHMEKRYHIGFWWESQNERYHKEDLNIGGLY
jgi:hypothetical protein